MPSKSVAQHNFMEMVAHNPGAARRAGVPQKVGKDFANADKMKAQASALRKIGSKKPDGDGY